MPRDKDRKRIIRERMKKTGESYTAARAHVLSKHTADRPAPPVRDLGALAGMTDAAVAAKTGRTWRQWVAALDADGAASMTHRDIAAIVHAKHHVGDWWAQTVTVGYERVKGLRERGQRRNGTYEATKSRTYNVPVAALFDAWANRAARRRWLDDVEPVVRRATRPKSMRLRWPDGTLVAVGFTGKGRGKSAVAVAHMQLRDRAASAKSKAYWAERLDALGALLGTAANRGRIR
jgi:hypothetical protein